MRHHIRVMLSLKKEEGNIKFKNIRVSHQFVYKQKEGTTILQILKKCLGRSYIYLVAVQIAEVKCESSNK